MFDKWCKPISHGYNSTKLWGDLCHNSRGSFLTFLNPRCGPEVSSSYTPMLSQTTRLVSDTGYIIVGCSLVISIFSSNFKSYVATTIQDCRDDH